MDKIRQYILDTIIGKHEGGYQTDEDDKGNYIDDKLIGTKFGISAPTLKEFLGKDITAEDMKNLDKETAADIMYNNYYKKLGIDKLPEELQENVFDMTINSGRNGIKILQKKLGVTINGTIDKDTLSALKESGLTTNDYSDARAEYYKKIVENHEERKKFLDTWLKRADSFRTKEISFKYDTLIGEMGNGGMSNEVASVGEPAQPPMQPEEVSNIKEFKMDAEIEEMPQEAPSVKEVAPSEEPDNTPVNIKEAKQDLVFDEVNLRMPATEETSDEGWVSKTDTSHLGGKQKDITGVLDAAMELTTEGMGKDFGNKIMDASAIGMLMQSAANYILPSKLIDPDFDPRKDAKTFEDITKDLDNDQLQELMEKHSYNQQAFFTAAHSFSEKNKRKAEMQEYTTHHPVLSVANTVGSLLVDAGAFMPVSTAIGASGAAIAGVDMMATTAPRLGVFAAGEFVEQGMQEMVWAANNKEYEFDPMIFGFGILAGSAIRNLAHNTALNKHFKDFWHNQNGFIQLSKKEADRFIEVVKKEAEDKRAIAMATRIVERKEQVGKQIIKDITDDMDSLTKELEINKVEYKAAEKGSSTYKQLKSQRQKLQRRLRKLKKNLPIEQEMIENGTHPRLTAELTPELSVKQIAKSLDIPDEIVDSPMKLRRFLGIDGLPTDTDFVIEGEKNWQRVAGKQLEEMKTNKRLNANYNMKKVSEFIGDNEIGNRLYDLANTDGAISKYVFNKGNLVDSDNPLVGSFYNWLAPDGMGREGKSAIRAIQSQEKYAKMYGGQLMNIFHAHGDELYSYIKNFKGDNTILARLVSTFNADDYEETVMELFKKRLLLGEEGFKHEITQGMGIDAALEQEKLIEICNNFAKDYNELNGQIVEKMKQVGVKGVDFDSTEDFMHRSWDYTKTRSVNKADLQEAIFVGMKNHITKLLKEGAELDEEAIKTAARKFAYGIRSADITDIDKASGSYIKFLTKLAKKTEGEGKKVVEEEVKRLVINKTKKEAGDLASRVGLDVNVEIPNDGRKLSDLLDDNFIVTQKRYNHRMAARIAAAEHGIKDINELDDWVKEAVDLEVKRLADKGVPNPRGKVSHIKQSMEADVKSFKHGHLAGAGGEIDNDATDMIRFINKYNFARLMQHVGFSSIAEVGGTVAEAGVNTVFQQYWKKLIPHLKDIMLKRPTHFTDELYDEIRTITGIGLEDYAFSTRGTASATRIFKKGIAHKVEQGVDILGRTTQGTFGGIETINRRLTANSLAITWGKHFKGSDKADGIMSIFFGSRGTSNRVIENAGLGEFIDGKFVTNDKYEALKKAFLEHPTYDKRGNLVKLNLHKWDAETASMFGDVLSMQASHILVDPDTTTQALWQTTTIGRILNQYRTFAINANTKVFGYAAANAAQGLKHGDMAEVIKFQSKLFWATALGTLAIGLRENVKTVGDGKGFSVSPFDEGIIKGLAIGFSRSSMTGGWDAIIDGVGGGFGFDPIFNRTSSYGRSRNFFNFQSTPMGQAVSGIYRSATNAAQGNFKKAGLGLFKVSPIYRQFGVQQIFNYTQRDE